MNIEVNQLHPMSIFVSMDKNGAVFAPDTIARYDGETLVVSQPGGNNRICLGDPTVSLIIPGVPAPDNKVPAQEFLLKSLKAQGITIERQKN